GPHRSTTLPPPTHPLHQPESLLPCPHHPPAHLRTAEWSAWGESFLHTLLAAAHISKPRAPVEKMRIWNQTSLPTTLGGLGLTNPSTEGSYAYLASAIATVHLLRSLGSKMHQEVAKLAPLLDADPANPAALPQRLADAEACLPPSTAAVMKREGREKGEGLKLQHPWPSTSTRPKPSRVSPPADP
ncbi:unnamed protein product, partial [Closterium sp. NIES-53]